MYLYLNTVLAKIFAIVFVFGKFIVFAFKYYAMYLDPKLVRYKFCTMFGKVRRHGQKGQELRIAVGFLMYSASNVTEVTSFV